MAPAFFGFPVTVSVFPLCFQNAHVNSWPASRQVLMGSWQHLPALSSQRTVPQTLVPDALTATADTWRQSLMVSGGKAWSGPPLGVWEDQKGMGGEWDGGGVVKDDVCVLVLASLELWNSFEGSLILKLPGLGVQE